MVSTSGPVTSKASPLISASNGSARHPDEEAAPALCLDDLQEVTEEVAGRREAPAKAAGNRGVQSHAAGRRQATAGECHSVAGAALESTPRTGNSNWGGRTRTSNFPVNSRALCQLSYTPLGTALASARLLLHRKKNAPRAPGSGGVRFVGMPGATPPDALHGGFGCDSRGSAPWRPWSLQYRRLEFRARAQLALVS